MDNRPNSISVHSLPYLPCRFREFLALGFHLRCELVAVHDVESCRSEPTAIAYDRGSIEAEIDSPRVILVKKFSRKFL